jgi:hypothetical protein
MELRGHGDEETFYYGVPNPLNGYPNSKHLLFRFSCSAAAVDREGWVTKYQETYRWKELGLTSKTPHLQTHLPSHHSKRELCIDP